MHVACVEVMVHHVRAVMEFLTVVKYWMSVGSVVVMELLKPTTGVQVVLVTITTHAQKVKVSPNSTLKMVHCPSLQMQISHVKSVMEKTTSTVI